MNLWNSLEGMVAVELVSAAPQESLGAINAQGIPVYRVKQISDLTVCFVIHRRDWRELSAFAEKNGVSVRIFRRTGIYWTIKRLLGRPVLLAGSIALLLFMLYLPGRILFVRVEGNATIPDRQILSAAETCGIRFWASRSQVRSEKMKNSLLSAIPQLQWAGVNTRGCTAIISVRERVIEDTELNIPGITGIVAAKDGVIDSVTVTRGNGLIVPGQAVREGQILISGYTDCGICIRATGAEGEVFALTNRKIRMLMPAQYSLKAEITDVKRKYSLLIGKKRINLWKDSGIWDASCGRMYEEYYITLPGGFQLPAALAVETYTVYEGVLSKAEPETAENRLPAYAQQYLLHRMVAGEIRNSDIRISQQDGVYLLEGTYLCREMIGRVQWEQIGEEHGKIG